MTLISKVGGAAGPLYGTLFLQMGTTAAGREAVSRLRDAQHAWADAVGAEVGGDELRRTLESVRRIVAASRAYRAG